MKKAKRTAKASKAKRRAVKDLAPRGRRSPKGGSLQPGVSLPAPVIRPMYGMPMPSGGGSTLTPPI